MSLTHLRSPLSLTVTRAACASLGALLLAACPGDDTSQDTDPTEGTSTGVAQTEEGPGPDTTAADTTVPTTSATGSTTETLDDTGTTADDTTGPPPPAGTCTGLTEAGHVNTVLSRDGMPIDATCDPNPAACGGDVVGDWVLEDSCGLEAFPNPLEDDCPGSTFAIEILSQSGTMSFVDDGTFVQDFDIESQVVFGLDTMACFGVACDVFQNVLQMDNPGATCEDMGGTCNCVLPDDGMAEVAMGTYEIIGDALLLTIGEDTAGFDFCIGGDRLDLWQPFFGIPDFTETACMDEQDCIDALGDAYDVYLCEMDEG